MKRTFLYALAVTLGATLVPAAAIAQPFPDTPETHWATEAIARLRRAGLLVGYPDGLYRGGRPASRYEMAVAIHATYSHLNDLITGLTTRIAALEQRDPVGPGGTDDLRRAITALQGDVAKLREQTAAIADLRRLADQFQSELQAIGVDVEAMRRDLADMDARVRALEGRRPAVDVSGDVNLFLIGGHGANVGTETRFGMNRDGRILGVGDDGFNRVGAEQDLSVFHELALTIAGTNDTGPRWRGTVVYGNMLGFQSVGGPGNMPIGNQSQIFPGMGYREGIGSFYVQDLGVKFDTGILGRGVSVEAGRIGYRVSPFIFERINPSVYFTNDRWDSGRHMIDGAVLGFNFGSAKLDFIVGRMSSQADSNGTLISPVVSRVAYLPGQMPMDFQLDRILGANLQLPLFATGNLNLAYLTMNSNVQLDPGGVTPPGVTPNRLNVFGGTIDFTLGNLILEAGASQSDLAYNERRFTRDENQAWHAKAHFAGPRWGINGGYQMIESNYAAPGNWGRLGVLRNPTNVEGFNVGAHFDLTNALRLTARADFLDGRNVTNTALNWGAASPFDADTSINNLEVRLDYRMNPNLSLLLGYERAQFDGVFIAPGVRGDSRYEWSTIGLGYGLSDRARLTVAYELGNVANDFITSPGTSFRGGQISSQLSVKF
jgi:hypothetical protein